MFTHIYTISLSTEHPPLAASCAPDEKELEPSTGMPKAGVRARVGAILRGFTAIEFGFMCGPYIGLSSYLCHFKIFSRILWYYSCIWGYGTIMLGSREAPSLAASMGFVHYRFGS